MSYKGLFQTGLVFAILMSISWILFVACLMNSPDTSGLDEAGQYLAFSTENGSAMLYLWGGLLGSLFTIPVYLVVYKGFGRVSPTLIIPVVFGIVGAALLALSYMVDPGSQGYTFGPRIAEANTSEAANLVLMATYAQDSIEFTWDFSSFLAYGLALIWIPLLLLRSTNSSKFLNYIGIIGGLAGLVWLFDLLPFTPPSGFGFILVAVNILAVIVWMIGITVQLVKQPEITQGPTQLQDEMHF